MARLARWAAALLSSTLVAGCATMTVSSHVDRASDFSRYHTFDWGPADELPTGDPRLDRNPFFKDYMQGAVERQLAARGIQMADSPDLRIHYHASVANRFSVNALDEERGYCYGGDCTSAITDYEAGTIVLDIVDARTNRLIWRGWAQDALRNLIDDRETMKHAVDKAVEEMLARLPRNL